MLRKLVILLINLLFINVILADNYSKEKTTDFVVTPSITYRYDVFKWSIPSDRFPDKKRSELVWKNHIVQPSIKLELEPHPNQFSILGQAKYGYILKNQSNSWDHDLDFERDGTGNIITIPDSTTKSQATGNILDLSAAIGYSLNLFSDNLLTFYLGYDYTDYRNKNYGSHQLLYKAISRSSSQLNQKYYFTTQSPWLGLSLHTPITDNFSITPTIKYYSFKHIGKGYWIHRGDLKQNPSLKNNAKGIGLGVDVDILYKCSDNLDFKINLEARKFKMKTGKNQAFYNSFGFGGEGVANGKLLDLTHISSSISAGFNYKL